MVNTKKLKAIFAENGLTQNEVAKLIGISSASLNEKINNKKDFRVREILKLCNIFSIENKDSIFFTK